MTDTSITVYADGPHDADSLDRAIVAWLDAKAKRSESAGTVRLYRTMLADFAAHLAMIGLRLDSSDLTAIADAAQAWAGHARRRATVARSTYNNRLAVLSSFYAFACKRGHLAHNPIDRIDRAQVQEYAGAHPLSFAEVQARLAAIDRSTLIGARDYALLLLALYTGRRASELAGLTWNDLDWKEPVTVTWQRIKGGRVERNILPPEVYEAISDWMHMASPVEGLVSRDTPLWLALSPRGTLTARRLSPRSLSLLCERRIGTSKVHATRHTFAAAMLAAGATLPEIQVALGHSSLAVTGTYVKKLRTDENPYAGKLAALYGLTSPPASSSSSGGTST